MLSRREFMKQSAWGLFLGGQGLGWLGWDDCAPPSIPAGQYGNIWVMETAPGAEVVINGRRCVYFGGTGYFGLQGHPEIIQAGIKAFRQYGLHIATSRTGFGNNPVLLAVEKKIAAFFGTEDAVYLPSGYLSNLVLVQGLAENYDRIFMDEIAHFSIRDAVYSVRKPVATFKHRDPEDLRRQLQSELKPKEKPLVITDGLFPTFGLIAPIQEYAKIVDLYDGLICLDDAHAVGVLGPNGRGTYDYYGLKGSRFYFGGTLSKAFGGFGGFVPGAKSFVDKVRSTVGVYSGASPTPTPVAAATLKAIELVSNHPEWREKLRENVAFIKAGMRRLGFDVDDSPVPIVTWTMESAEKMKKIQQALFDRGIAIAYLRYVGAPSGGVLRASIFSTHTRSHLERLLAELGRLL